MFIHILFIYFLFFRKLIFVIYDILHIMSIKKKEEKKEEYFLNIISNETLINDKVLQNILFFNLQSL